MSDLTPKQYNLTDEVNEIITEFHSAVFKVLKICKKIDPDNADLEWLSKTLSLAREIDPLLIINRSKDKIWTYREEIINENEDFFLKNKFSQFIKNDHNKNFMYSFIGLIKSKIKELSGSEKKLLWDLTKQLLVAVTKYKKAINDYA